jgi:competence protein ComEA
MIQELLKDKKKVGIGVLLFIVIIVSGIVYAKSGYKDLKKNDTESIFVENSEESEQLNENKNSSNKNNSKKNNGNVNNKELTVPAQEKTIVVEIKGEVKKPDVYILNENAIVKELIEAAGGLTENAELNNINRAKKLQNHELIYIANKNDANKEVSSINSETKTTSNKVNINTAALEDLKKLNGIGDSKAKSIIEYREQNGSFKSIEDIRDVTGIGEKMFERIKDQIET